jgi:hypothetical protein
MSTLKGVITFKDLKANHSAMRFKGAAGKALADVTTLKTAIAAFSDCHVRAEGLMDKLYYDIVGAGNRDNKAVCTFSDADGETHKYMIPGFNGTPLQDKEGDYVNPTDLATIQAAIEVFTGESFSPLRSPVIKTT